MLFLYSYTPPRGVDSEKVFRVCTEMSYASVARFSLLSFSSFPNCLK